MVRDTDPRNLDNWEIAQYPTLGNNTPPWELTFACSLPKKP